MKGLPEFVPVGYGGGNVAAKSERRTRSQALIKGVAFEEAGGAVSAANHHSRSRLESEPKARHDLLVVCVVAGASGANDSARDRSSRHVTGIFHGSVRQNVRGAVIDLVPRLVKLVAQAEVESES